MIKKIIAGILSTAMLFSMTACAAGSGTDSSADYSAKIEGNINDVQLKQGDKYAVISVKDYGDITIKLFSDVAPKGVENFISLAESGFYNGKKFHRIVEDFMAQAGQADDETKVEQFDVEANYSARHFYGALCYANALGKNSTQFFIVNNNNSEDLESYSIAKMENYIKMYEDAAEKYDEGTDAYNYYAYNSDYYARTKLFFENADDAIKKKYKEVGGTPSLDGNYTVFGQTVDGFDVIEKISSVKVEANLYMNSDEISKPVDDVIIETITIKEYNE